MTVKRVVILVLINLLPLAFMFLYALDLKDVIAGNGNYPFGSDFFSPYSIYRSKAIYVAFASLSIIGLTAMIVASIKGKWKWYGILLFINVIIALYPMFTNE